MPEGYSRSRSRLSSEYSGNRSGNSQSPRGGSNSMLYIIIAAVVVVVIAVVAIVNRGAIAQMFNGGNPAASATVAPSGGDATEIPDPSTSPDTAPSATPEAEVSTEPTTEPTTTPQASEDITISAVGDITVDSAELTDAKDSTSGEYDFTPFFTNIKDKLSASDLTIGTLESPLAGKDAKYSGSPKYNTPESMLTALKDAGIDMLSTAHFHIFDQGFTGVEKTIENLNNADIQNTGTYLSKNDYYKPLMMTVKDTKVAILAYSDSEKYQSSIAADKMSFAIKHTKLKTIKEDIKKAKEDGAQIVIVMMSWGKEADKAPTSDMKTQAESIIKYGADLIVGSNPQFVQKISRVTVTRADNSQGEGIVAYSLGTFISKETAAGKDSAVILNVTFQKDAANKVTIKDASYVPTWVYVDSKSAYTILPVAKYKDSEEQLGTLTSSAQTRIKKVWDEIVAAVANNDIKAVTE